MGALENMDRRGIHPNADVKYRDGLGPKWLARKTLQVLHGGFRDGKGKISVSDGLKGGDWWEPRKVGRGWHSMFEPVKPPVQDKSGWVPADE